MLKTPRDIYRFFVANETPIYFINTSPFNLIGADWMGGLTFINTIDCFSGLRPNVFVPPDAAARTFTGFEAANQYLLEHPAVVNRLKPGGNVMFLRFDRRNEIRAAHLGLRICLPNAALRIQLDSKLITTRLASRAGIASVPNVMAKVANYRELRSVARDLGEDLVVQLPYGDSGKTTFFIRRESDFEACANRIATNGEVKIMKRIRCRQSTIEGCVTRSGTLVGPLQTELVGFGELTHYGGGWCGNEVFAASDSTVLTAAIRLQAQRAVIALGEQLKRTGYRGCFGLDFLIDTETGILYLGEMNPRITGASPMTSQAAVDAGVVPLLLFHLLEWFGEDYAVDVETYNRHWLEAERLAGWSQMIMDDVGGHAEQVVSAPTSGIWRLEPGGTVTFQRTALNPQTITGEDEVMFLRTIDLGQTRTPGTCLGRLIVRGRLMTDDYQLNNRARRLTRAFNAEFHAASDSKAAA